MPQYASQGAHRGQQFAFQTSHASSSRCICKCGSVPSFWGCIRTAPSPFCPSGVLSSTRSPSRCVYADAAAALWSSCSQHLAAVLLVLYGGVSCVGNEHRKLLLALAAAVAAAGNAIAVAAAAEAAATGAFVVVAAAVAGSHAAAICVRASAASASAGSGPVPFFVCPSRVS